jgi:hypothetical protein
LTAIASQLLTMPKKHIHVNQHKIKANLKHGTNDPVITVKEGKKNTYGHSVQIHGPSTVIYGGNDKPVLSCGARVVIQTEAEVTID